ncbi:MAG: hypothetical protein IKA10_00095 [Oscillospiraceae bacterium]|nr:hypothetical protein [Oscillospiraceae bacterium]
MLKNRLKKITATIVALAMVLALTACGGGGTQAPENSDTPRATPQATETPDNSGETGGENDWVMLQQAMIDTTDMSAVAYLGWFEDYYDLYDYAQIEEYIADTSVAEDHPFIAQIDAEHFVPHIGGQLFCIVPADENATITIYDYIFDEEDYTAHYGDALYQSDDGKPVLVMCNESEVIPNIIVEIVDSYGNEQSYIPWLSGMDGRLEVPYDAPTVLDFTPYEKLGYVSENNYTFDPAVLYYAENWTAYVETINDDEVSVGLWFDEYGNMEMCYEVYGGTGYEVYYEGYWYPAEDSSYPDSTLVFELSLVEDNSDIQIARPEIYTAMSFEYDEDYECVYMRYEDYDYLLDVERDFYYTLYNAAG